MKYAVFSDIHANAVALRRVVAEAKLLGAEAMLCLGDVVGYGPQPDEAVRILLDENVMTIAGNHDDAVSGRMTADGFAGLAADSIARHRKLLDAQDLEFLRSLPYVHRFSTSVVAAHGDVTEPEKFYYVENEKDAGENFRATKADLIFVGHTHVPALFITGQSGRVYKTGPQDFVIEPGKRYIVNPGSVGYPREEGGVCRSSFVMYDSDAKTVTFHYLPFLMESLLERGAPADEPETETAAQQKTVQPPQKKNIQPLPQRESPRWPIFAAVALAAAFLLALAFINSPWGGSYARRHRYDNVPKIVPEGLVATTANMQLAAEKSINLSKHDRVVSFNLTLKKGSGPVFAEMSFRMPSGRTFRMDPVLVKKSSSRSFEIPREARGALTAVFRLYAAGREGPQVAIASFEPSSDIKPQPVERKSKNRKRR